MTPPSLPPAVFDALPPAVQAYIRYLEARLAELEARLGQTSANSSKPPSSDPPHAKPAPPKVASGKQRGGQPGHPKRTRPALPPDTVVELRAGACDRCSHPLTGDDPAPLRPPPPPPRPPGTPPPPSGTRSSRSRRYARTSPSTAATDYRARGAAGSPA